LPYPASEKVYSSETVSHLAILLKPFSHNKKADSIKKVDSTKKVDMINNIRRGIPPSRPTNPSQNQRLQDRVWDMITTSWNGKPTYRCELSVMHHILSAPSLPDALVEFPPVGRKNLIQLAEELLYTFLVLPLDPHQRVTLRTVHEYISNVISRDEASPTVLSSAEVAAVTETRHEVILSH
jgi:hypothetical protein